MKTNKDFTIFELVGATNSNYEDPRTGGQARGLGSFGLSHTQTILYKDSDGDQWEREVRYMPTQRSVFVDVQNETLTESQLNKVSRLVSKPRFVNGLLMVQSNQKNLLEYLRSHPQKEGNEGLRVSDKQRTIFRERDAAEIAKKMNETTKKQVNAEMLVFSAPFEEKIIPIAKYLMMDIDQDAELILWNVKQYAVNNPEDFLELMDNPTVDRVASIEKAIGLGILRVNGQRILWADGRQIVDVPANLNPTHYLAELSFDNSHRTTWNEIGRLIDKRTSPQKDAETIVEAESTSTDALDELSASDLFESLKAEGAIEWKPPYFYFGDERLGKGKDESVKAIAVNKKLYAAKLMD